MTKYSAFKEILIIFVTAYDSEQAESRGNNAYYAEAPPVFAI